MLTIVDHTVSCAEGKNGVTSSLRIQQSRVGENASRVNSKSTLSEADIANQELLLSPSAMSKPWFREPIHQSSKQVRKWSDRRASEACLRTVNPIRRITDNLKPDPSCGKSLLTLGIGDPTVAGHLNPPASATIGLSAALAGGKVNGYTPSLGLADARRGVAEYISRMMRVGVEGHDRPDVSVDAVDVILTAGCTQALEVCLTALSNSGCNILIPRPCFPLYLCQCSLLGIEVRFYDLDARNGWRVKIEDLYLLADVNTVALLICNPGNPTGSVFGEDHLKEIVKAAHDLCLPIIADEVYHGICFGENEREGERGGRENGGKRGDEAEAYEKPREGSSRPGAKGRDEVEDNFSGFVPLARVAYDFYVSLTPPSSSPSSPPSPLSPLSSSLSHKCNGLKTSASLPSSPLPPSQANLIVQTDFRTAPRAESATEFRTGYRTELANRNDFRAEFQSKKCVPVLTVSSISKRFLLPGWRFGWIHIMDPSFTLKECKLGEAFNNLMPCTSSPSSLVQAAAPHILLHTPPSFFRSLNASLAQNAKFCFERASGIPGLKCGTFVPEGSMFFMVQIDVHSFSDLRSDEEWCQKLMKEQSVVVLPGVGFGLPNWVRIALCVTPETLREAFDRIQGFCEEHANIEVHANE